MMIVVLYQIDSLDDVGMMQSRRDAEFRCQFLDVILFRLILATFSEFLQDRQLYSCLIEDKL